MDKMEGHILQQEANNREDQIVRSLKKAEKEARDLAVMLQAVSNPTEKQKELSEKERIQQRANALDLLSSGARSYNAAYLGTLASEMRAMLDTHHAFTERLWEREI